MTVREGETGFVFNIQRFSLNDGPGIRTAVFLKGCPLRCVWCHNPESWEIRPQVSYDGTKCAGCGACREACPAGAHSFSEGCHTLDFSACAACGKCGYACPAGALGIIGYAAGVEDIVRTALKDKRYYENSGGGVTLTGGEPMMQFEFAKNLLSCIKSQGVNTCVETCGFSPEGRFEEILPLVDTFLFDYKDTDPGRHKKLTGIANERILSNLDVLMKAGANVILRCPLVPGVNDSADHLAGIAALCGKYPALKGVEIMAYHDLGRSKGGMIGAGDAVAAAEPPDEGRKQGWLETLRRLGCGGVTLG